MARLSYSIGGRRKPLLRIVALGILDYVSLLTGYVSYLATADVRRAGANATANRLQDRSWKRA